MIFLFTDFGSDDLYVGQVKAVLAQHAPAVPVIDLLHSVPPFDVRAGAHLLDALYRPFNPGAVFFAVIDPGVGGPREAVVMLAEGYWFVGPDNGLLAVVAARAAATRIWHITWQPEKLSSSFHGRDLFAPMAAWIAAGAFPADKLELINALAVQGNAEDISRIIYIDHYGNCMTGLRARSLSNAMTLNVTGHALRWARTFSEVEAGVALWYENSLGLVEIAVNGGSAAWQLGLHIGDGVVVS